MTEATKLKIVMYKNKGFTPSEISRELGISRETIKTYCRRHYKMPDFPESEDNHCVECGKYFEFGKRKAKFCSDDCRKKWWYTHPEYLSKKAFYFQICQCCGVEFAAYGNNRRKYCSHECYIKQRFKGGNNGETDQEA